VRKPPEFISTPQPLREALEDTILELRGRIAKLETENAHLRQLEETIGRNARLMDALLERSHDGFSLITPQMTVLRVIHSVLGNTDDALAGRPLLVKIHPEDRAQATAAFSRLLSNPSQSVTVEWRVSDDEGHWRWMEVEMTDMLDDPDVQAIVMNSRYKR
jgi:PAS domain S-box-containing protein